MARKYQEGLPESIFGQDPLTNSTNVRGLDMRPTLGLEVVMVRQGRTLAHAINFKRRMTVRRQFFPFTFCSSLVAAEAYNVKPNKYDRSFQDPCHSVAHP